MKKMATISIAILMMLSFFSGCTATKGSYAFVNSKENSGNGFWAITYDSFNGYKQRTIKRSDDGSNILTIEIVTESGTLDVSITDDSGASVYSGVELNTSTFEVPVNSGEKYTIKLEAVDHIGSFSVKW